MKITHVDPDSPLAGQVRPGYRVLAVNGRPVLDSIDFRFRPVVRGGTQVHPCSGLSPCSL